MDDIQSWWEVPSIAHFCSLFRVAFNLLDFDIEELEEALITDGTELNGSCLIQDLIVRLLSGCLGHNGISTFNYQMFLRRLFRAKCKEQGRDNPFNTDIDFQFLPLRTKVEILHCLCDFRLDADDVIDVLKNLDSDSLRVHPLGHDDKKSAYWYFYGTRLYKEDYPKKRKRKRDRKRRRGESSSEYEEDETLPDVTSKSDVGTPLAGSIPGEGTNWKVVCYTEIDWKRLADEFEGSTSKDERVLHSVLSEDFLPEIPRLFEEKERLQRKRMAESRPRRQSRRIEKMKTEKDDPKKNKKDKRNGLSGSVVSDGLMSESDMDDAYSSTDDEDGEQGKMLKEIHTNFGSGRQTNNSLSSITGNILIKPQQNNFNNSTLFRRSREDLMTGMYKILDRIKADNDSWPFRDPVDEAYAPKYYSVIAKPMDLQTMEDKLDNGEYGALDEFRADFRLIVDNCRQYNGSVNEYTEMAVNLQGLFEASIERYLDPERSSGDESGRKIAPTRRNIQSLVGESLSSSGGDDDEDDDGVISDCTELKRDDQRQSRQRINYNESITDSEDGCDYEVDRAVGSSSESSSSRATSDDSYAKKNKNKTKVKRAGVIKNLEAIEALELVTEQTLKDINRWLDETPKFSDFSSRSNSPVQAGVYEELEADYRRRMRPMRPRDRLSNDLRRRVKEGKKKREMRTIDRLQPGKSKGNLLSKEIAVETNSEEPKLSLGKLLETVPGEASPLEESEPVEAEEKKVDRPTPNLSAWFKAFGAPKKQKKDEPSSTPAASNGKKLGFYRDYYKKTATGLAQQTPQQNLPVKKRLDGFAPTKEAVENERIFTPTPGKMPGGPSQPLPILPLIYNEDLPYYSQGSSSYYDKPIDFSDKSYQPLDIYYGVDKSKKIYEPIPVSAFNNYGYVDNYYMDRARIDEENSRLAPQVKGYFGQQMPAPDLHHHHHHHHHHGQFHHGYQQFVARPLLVHHHHHQGVVSPEGEPTVPIVAQDGDRPAPYPPPGYIIHHHPQINRTWI